jgi:hypothetical protein
MSMVNIASKSFKDVTFSPSFETLVSWYESVLLFAFKALETVSLVWAVNKTIAKRIFALGLFFLHAYGQLDNKNIAFKPLQDIGSFFFYDLKLNGSIESILLVLLFHNLKLVTQFLVTIAFRFTTWLDFIICSRFGFLFQCGTSDKASLLCFVRT